MFNSGSYWNINGFTLCYTSIAMGKKTPFFMGKLTVSMAIFNSYVRLPEGISDTLWSFKIDIEHGPLIVDLPSYKMAIFHTCVSSPEGI